MKYVAFSFWFMIIHTAAYTIAGVLALHISKDLYKERERLFDFLRNMSDKNESGHVQKYFLPAQLLRGVLMSVVLYPVIDMLGQLSFGLRSAFLFGLMFIFTDLASAVPFANNIEGLVYFKDRYLKKNLFWKLYLETAIYSVLFAFLAGWFLF
ncbi:MAG: hypothetical protein ACLFVQ_04965 [Chitinispirillaceae bacterium]